MNINPDAVLTTVAIICFLIEAFPVPFKAKIPVNWTSLSFALITYIVLM